MPALRHAAYTFAWSSMLIAFYVAGYLADGYARPETRVSAFALASIAAFDFVSFAAPFEHRAFVSLDTGAIYWISETSPLDEEDLPRVKNFNVSVKEVGDKIIFMRKLIPGGADHSFGIEVARMAGLPEPVIERAREILQHLESQHLAVETLGAGEASAAQLARRHQPGAGRPEVSREHRKSGQNQSPGFFQ